MKAIETKNDAHPQPTTAREQADSKVPSENKNLFRDSETRSQPCLSFLYAISDAAVPRREEQKPPQVSAPGTHQMHDVDRKFIDAGFSQARKICKDFLSFLIRYDSGITPDDAQILCAAINAIERSSA